MRSLCDKVRRLSDERLLNALRYQDLHPFPPEYLECCRQELLRRGYTIQELAREIERFRYPERTIPLTRIEYRRQRRLLLRRRWLLLGTLILLGILLLSPAAFPPSAKTLLGTAALVTLLLILRVQFRLNALDKEAATVSDTKAAQQ